MRPLQRKSISWCLPKNHTKENILQGQNVEFEAGGIITVFSWVHTHHNATVSLN